MTVHRLAVIQGTRLLVEILLLVVLTWKAIMSVRRLERETEKVSVGGLRSGGVRGQWGKFLIPIIDMSA